MYNQNKSRRCRCSIVGAAAEEYKFLAALVAAAAEGPAT